MSREPHFRLAMIGVLSATLMLAGCGRKGPLDLPPGASAPPPVTAASQADAPFPGAPPVAEAGYGPEGQPLAPAGPKRRIPLDWLLD